MERNEIFIMESVGLITKKKEKVKEYFIPEIPERPSALTDLMYEAANHPKGKINKVWSASFLEHTSEEWLDLLEE